MKADPENRLRQLPLTLLVLLHLAALGMLFVFPSGIWPVTLLGGRLRIPAGLVHAEIAVIAAWAAWSKMTLALRVPLALLASLLAGFVLVAAFPPPRYARTELIVMTLATALLQSLLIQGLCSAASLFGIEWRRVDGGGIPAERRAQFHLWELLAFMAAVALLLGGLR